MRSLIAAMLLVSPTIAVAQQAAPAAQAAPSDTIHIPAPDSDAAANDAQSPKRIRSVMLSAGERCPTPSATEIIVCSTIEDPYRIPRNLRRTEIPVANRAWATRTEALDDAQRRAGGLPNTCSPVGSGGQSGCTQQLLQQWTAEQVARRNGTYPQ